MLKWGTHGSRRSGPSEVVHLGPSADVHFIHDVDDVDNVDDVHDNVVKVFAVATTLCSGPT